MSGDERRGPRPPEDLRQRPAAPWTRRPLLRAGAAVILGLMTEVTRILTALEQGEPHAAEQLLPLVYDELRQLAARKLAQEKPGQTLQATALVHEAYLRLVGGATEAPWNSRSHWAASSAWRSAPTAGGWPWAAAIRP